MPSVVPLSNVSLYGDMNAGLLAAQILALNNDTLSDKLKKFKSDLSDKVLKDDSSL